MIRLPLAPLQIDLHMKDRQENLVRVWGVSVSGESAIRLCQKKRMDIRRMDKKSPKIRRNDETSEKVVEEFVCSLSAAVYPFGTEACGFAEDSEALAWKNWIHL